MLTAANRLLIQEILHRLELKEPVSVVELIYLHKEANQYPDVERWVKKLLTSKDFLGKSLEVISETKAA